MRRAIGFFAICMMSLMQGCATLQHPASLDTDAMNHPARYFEIPVTDMPRAIAFYERVFGDRLTLQTIDGNQMALFPDTETGITGALAKGESYVPGHAGIRLYFNTRDIDATLAKAVEAGGRVLYPRTDIGDLGWVAEFEDSEGNCIALHQSR